jgi:hypothetical protein
MAQMITEATITPGMNKPSIFTSHAIAPSNGVRSYILVQFGASRQAKLLSSPDSIFRI